MPGSLVEVAYNLALNVQPHITADGAVQMKLEIKGDSPSKTTGGRAKKETRSLKTTLLKQSGETAVIGGLYESRVSKLVTGVPFLSQIPLIGALFRSTETSNGKKDLLIMVTPTIIGQGGMTTDAGAIIDYPGPGSAGVQQSNSAADNAATNSTSETNSQNQAEVQENSNSADLLPTNASNESNNL
jgi:type II secretory pathway component GspD/PulD (secretin)